MNNIQVFYLGLSLFISHYVFDFIILIYKYELKKNLTAYLTLQIIISTLYVISPPIFITLLIYLLMYYFGEDIRYLFDGKAAFRWLGVLLFSFSILFDKEEMYFNILKNLGIEEKYINHILINTSLLIIPSIIIIPWKIKNIIPLLFSITIGLQGVINGLIPYLIPFQLL